MERSTFQLTYLPHRNKPEASSTQFEAYGRADAIRMARQRMASLPSFDDGEAFIAGHHDVCRMVGVNGWQHLLEPAAR